jgi:hypothetical protein
MRKFNLTFILILTLVLSASFGGVVYAEPPVEPTIPSGGPIANPTGSSPNPLLPPMGQNTNTSFPGNTGVMVPDPDFNPTGTRINAGGAPNQAVSLSGETVTREDTLEALALTLEATQTEDASQAAAYNRASQESDPALTADYQAAKQDQFKTVAAEVIGCSAGQILGNILSSLVSSLITTATQKLVTKVADALLTVPVAESGQNLLNSNTQSSAEVGTTIGVFGIGVLTLPSWNSIAYCVVNAMITYVANSTIAWVQGGFEGNPSFVTNPEEFFTNLANIEASAFLQELAYGVTGLNICEPFRVQIVLTIARDFVGNQQGYGGQNGYSRGGFGGGGGNMGYGGCSLDDIAGNLEGFLRGNFYNGGWDSWYQISQIDTNNPYATYFNLQSQLNGSVARRQNLATIELDWGKGFLSFRKCEEGTPESEKQNCPITSPGVVIQGQLEKTLGLAKDRLVLAEKFDQVIAVVVNQLVQVALDKVLETIVE